MKKLTAHAAGGALPKCSSADTSPSRLASDPVAAAIEAHKLAAAAEREAFDALLAVAAEGSPAEQKAILAYVANSSPESIVRALLRISTANKAPERSRQATN